MTNKLLLWIPRILGFLAILFMLLFSFDCFDESNTTGEKLTCFFMHNIPCLVCLVALIVAWRWELSGGILFILFFVAGGVFFKSFTGNYGSLIVISPFLLTGILFIISHFHKKKLAVK